MYIPFPRKTEKANIQAFSGYPEAEKKGGLRALSAEVLCLVLLSLRSTMDTERRTREGPPPKVRCPRQSSSFLVMPYLRGGKKVDKVKKRKRKKNTYSETGLPVCRHLQRIVHLEYGTPLMCVIWYQVSPFCDLWVVQS